jgi:hypothetical protein
VSGLVVEFSVPTSLLGLIIGKKGIRIKQIEVETGVRSINVDGENGWNLLTLLPLLY